MTEGMQKSIEVLGFEITRLQEKNNLYWSENHTLAYQRRILLELVQEILGSNNCICALGIGHPEVTDHSERCKKSRAIVEECKK